MNYWLFNFVLVLNVNEFYEEQSLKFAPIVFWLKIKAIVITVKTSLREMAHYQKILLVAISKDLKDSSFIFRIALFGVQYCKLDK